MKKVKILSFNEKIYLYPIKIYLYLKIFISILGFLYKKNIFIQLKLNR